MNHPEQQLLRRERARVFEQVLGTLSQTESAVISCRFGVWSLTQRQTASAVGLSLHHTRKVEQKALRKLRHPSRSSALRKEDATELLAKGGAAR